MEELDGEFQEKMEISSSGPNFSHLPSENWIFQHTGCAKNSNKFRKEWLRTEVR